MSWTVLQSIGFVLGLFGIGLTAVGLIGRRLGPGLRCRSCGYDVADIVAEQKACPECGRSIVGKRGTVSGRHVRRRGALVAGLLLLVPASAMGWYVSTVTQPVSARPTLLLAGTLVVGHPGENAGAARELLARWRASELNGLSRRALVSWGVSPWVDAHPDRNWQHAEVTRFAMASGVLGETDTARFIEQVLVDAGDASSTPRQRLALQIARELGTTIRPRLERALEEPAFRPAAVMLLLDELDNEPSTALVDAAVASLAAQPGDASTGPAADRLPIPIAARRAARYLTHHAERSAPSLRNVLANPSSSQQQRLMAALVLTEENEPGDADAIGRAAGASLNPNDIAGDALLASRALLRAGPDAIRAAETSADHPAARSRLRELSLALRDPARPLPPHLERLAGPLPWQTASTPRPRRRLLP